MRSQAVRDLALSVGDFIRYWGFRRVHGAIWAQLFLSRRPMSCTELAEHLNFTKALISPALAELEQWGLIELAEAPDSRTILYRAVADVDSVIKRVLREREVVLIKAISQNYKLTKRQMGEDVDPERLEELGAMIGAASAMLQILLGVEPVVELPSRVES